MWNGGMNEELVELLLQGLFLVAYVVASSVLAAAGVAMEYRGYLYSNSGETLLAVWMLGFGLVALGFAYFILTDKASTVFAEVSEQI